MQKQKNITEDKVSLLDIYAFSKTGWKTIFTATLLCGGIGIGIALTLPSKFIASASIQPARVLGTDIESSAVLAEKMRSPTYYSAQTLIRCEVAEPDNSAKNLAAAINPHIPRNSAFVSVQFLSKDTQTSEACINAVLEDVRRNHNDLIEHQIGLAKATLEAEKERLRLAEEIVSTLSSHSLSFDFKDTQFSASQLLLATLQAKQSEITTLTSSIQKTEYLLAEPQTKSASFTTPIYSPRKSVEPKRAVIVLMGLLAGAFVGLMLLVVQRALIQIRRQAAVHTPVAQAGEHP